MAKQIKWTLRAQQDRKEILHYWRLRNQSNTYSKKLNQLFKQAISLVATHPHIGRSTNIKNIRAKLVRDYLVFYEETENTIFILSIWDTRRDPEKMPY
jgi:addiction module RelE/StbE family toxin